MSVSTDAANPIVWMNVTTSANWKRSPVGVVRVEQELWRALSKRLGKSLRQVVYDNGAFVERSPGGMRLSRDDEDFWPDLPEFSSVDPFDPIKVKQSKLGSMRPSSPKAPPFKAGDVLITVGLDWDHGGLHEAIRQEVRRSELSVVTCCYDLIPIHYPQYCVGDVAAWFKNYLIGMTWSSHGILCISQNTRDDLLAFQKDVGLPERPTKVIKLGSNLPEGSGSDSLSESVEKVLAEPYFLYVSTIERRKNHAVLYRAYHLLRREFPEARLPKLVFVGMHGWGVEELLSDIALDPLTDGDIQFFNHVSDAELSALYQNCEAFLYPSFYEGWGLPIAEALQYGRPVLASSAGSIPEVGGDLVRYVDPWSPRDWARELLAFLEDKAAADRWSIRIKAEFDPYKWDDTANDVIELIREIGATRESMRTFAPGHDLSTVNGIHYGDKLIFAGKEGILCHGPYLSLAAGHYSAGFQLSLLSGHAGVVRLQVKANNGEVAIVTKTIDLEETTLGERQERVDFKLKDYTRNVEFIVEIVSSSEVKVSINKVELRTFRT